LILGDIDVDILMYGEEYPPKGGIVVTEKVKISGGGVGANIAVALARLNAKVKLAGAIGLDPWGRFVLKEIKRERVDPSLIQVIEGEHTGFMFIFVDKKGERTILGSRGANKKFQATKQVLDAISEVSHVHVSGYSLMDQDEFDHAILLLRRAKDLGVPTSVDIEGIAFQGMKKVLRLKGLVDYFMGNEVETTFLYQKLENKGVEKLREELDAKIFVIKAGKRGCKVIWDAGIESVQAMKVKAVDTTGAGDAFNAGFLLGISRGLRPLDACRLGNALAGYKCEGEGARHLPSRDQLVRRWPDLRSILQG
jgi:ribokinase